MHNAYQDNTPDKSVNSMENTPMTTSNGMKLDTLRNNGLSIQNMQVQALQIPNNDNGNVAVAKATLQTSKGLFEGVGAASPDNIGGSTDVNQLLGKAQAVACNYATGMAAIASQTQQGLPLPVMNQVQSIPSIPANPQKPAPHKKKFNHSETKPASNCQNKFVQDLCKREGISEIQAREKAGVQTDKPLTSADANQLIQHFNSNSN